MSKTSRSGWTVDTYKEHNEALRAAEREIQAARRDADKADEARRAAEEKFEVERDRRYKEVADEREKALSMKEIADRDALELAREIQKYKDEKANELREQINSERGLYASKADLGAAMKEVNATLGPVLDYVRGQKGPRALTTSSVAGVVGLLLGLAALITLFARR
jgi:chromosome segregation ATPase